jgi:hypothetical protein
MQLVQLELSISNEVIILIITLLRVLLDSLKLLTRLWDSKTGGALVSKTVTERL